MAFRGHDPGRVGQLAEDHVMLMGATTYRLMSEIVATGEEPTFPRMAELPQIVFSKTLRLPPRWANTTVMAEPVETAVPALKVLAGSLFRLGLVDRVRVMVFPTIRGEAGQEPTFADLPDLDLRLVLLDYRVAERPGDGRG
jgi:hypothetical protein